MIQNLENYHAMQSDGVIMKESFIIIITTKDHKGWGHRFLCKQGTKNYLRVTQGERGVSKFVLRS